MLQTPYFDERTLRSYLGRLAINLEAQVVNSNPESHDGPPGHEVIYSGSVQDGQDPFIVVQGPAEEADNESEGHIMVVWKISAFLVRPRLRLQNPSVVFSATASLKSADEVQNDTLSQEYLPSQIPSGINLLEVGCFLSAKSSRADKYGRHLAMTQQWEVSSLDFLPCEYLEWLPQLKS